MPPPSSPPRAPHTPAPAPALALARPSRVARPVSAQDTGYGVGSELVALLRVWVRLRPQTTSISEETREVITTYKAWLLLLSNVATSGLAGMLTEGHMVRTAGLLAPRPAPRIVELRLAACQACYYYILK